MRNALDQDLTNKPTSNTQEQSNLNDQYREGG